MEGGDISSDGELNISSVMEARRKERKSYGRIRDVKKKMRVQSHEMGPDCSTDAQNVYLCGLIAVLPVQRKTLKEGAKHCGASYTYRIRALVGENTKKFNVCRKAFIAIHGISKKKVEILVSSLKETGYAPQDKRESEGKKGSDDVCSLLHNFIYSHLDPEVNHMKIFCDSCSGEQKNFTFFRFLHNLVNNEKRLESVVVTFPIQGQSYMECDKNFGLVNQKSRAEVPEDWLQILEDARHSPTPFNVINVNHTLFRSWTKFLDNSYLKKSPFPSRPIRQIYIQRGALLQYRTTYNVAWESALLQGKRRKSLRLPVCHLKNNEFRLPEYSYEGQLPVYAEKFRDIQHLKKFYSRAAQEFFANLPHQ
ncbi:unnamed protein product [Psylliodes chrysocephalus]|uniref:Uncharacterized protein n=1 Tax=Psylliodes chrysocephalus TaxID=3402493 RepID=A0A9P0D883_9CUCU|nr:unnamed protein product [Psylliodes chrysocephala]